MVKDVRLVHDTWIAMEHSKPGEQNSIIQAFANWATYEKSSKKHKEKSDAITYHLCKDTVTANIVNNAGFQKIYKFVSKEIFKICN